MPLPAAARRPRHVNSPLVRRLLDTHGLTAGDVVPSGAGGRLTRDDVLRAASASRRGDTETDTDTAVRSEVTGSHVRMAIEVDYHRVDAARAPARPGFHAAEGFSLTYLPFIARAVVDALTDHPRLNARVPGAPLTGHPPVNLGIAVDLDADGLVVPVVTDAGSKRLRSIARDVHALATATRVRRPEPTDATVTFTLVNPGPFGRSLAGDAIEGHGVPLLVTGGIAARPVAIPELGGGYAFGVHPVGDLALTFDHRTVNGAYAASFLGRLKQVIETRDWSGEL